MATLKDDMKEQRESYDKALEEAKASAAEANASSLEISPEFLTVEMQAVASEARFERALKPKDKVIKPYYSYWDENVISMPTPYGRVQAACQYGDNVFVDLLNSMPESDKIGRKFLKEHKIKSSDYNLTREITNFFYCQSIDKFFEQNKGAMTPAEYNKYHTELQEELHKTIQRLNKKGFIVNPHTGDLEYKNPVLQQTLVAQRD